MALGSFEGEPVVLSGHDHGEIDVFALASGLPLPPLSAGTSSIGTVAYQHIGSRQVIAIGSLDGVVRALVLAEPGHCLIGTGKGLIAVRLPIPGRPGQDSGIRSRLHLPVDLRPARACPEHARHLQVAGRDGREAPRLCIKGVQTTWGQRAKHPLRYTGGHLYLLPDRIEIEGADGAAEAGPPLVLELGTFYPGRVDDPEAYQADGCHFGLALEEFVGSCRVLSCYRRSERDWLLDAITRLVR